jgi:hypothetical protein
MKRVIHFEIYTEDLKNVQSFVLGIIEPNAGVK